MNRRMFFLVAAVLAFFFGLSMILAPAQVTRSFSMIGSTEVSALFRAMGALILSTGVLNFLVRQHPDSLTLRSVLLFNIVSHILNIIVDCWGVIDGAMPVSAILGAQFVHLFICIGAWYYLSALRRESAMYP